MAAMPAAASARIFDIVIAGAGDDDVEDARRSGGRHGGHCGAAGTAKQAPATRGRQREKTMPAENARRIGKAAREPRAASLWSEPAQ